MSTALRNEAFKVLTARATWEQKQRLYYQMRHDGIRRQNKPFPRAADFHLPVVDSAIGKQKPFWFGQAANNDRLAVFLSKKQERNEFAESAAQFFDYTLRHCSEFLDKLTAAIDYMLLRGRGVLKATTDPANDHALVFECIDPVYILMADGADDFPDADWFVHVKHLTVAQYQRDARYEQDPETLQKIRGSEDDPTKFVDLDKQVREGITHVLDHNKIVLWEHWVKTAAGWTFHTYCPKCPEVKVKASVACPYQYDGKASLPFFSFPMEIKDGGWNSPRGIAEKAAPGEMLGCKLMNSFLDSLAFTDKPIFTAEGNIPNAANIRFVPGEFVPGNLKRVDMGGAPFELTNVMNMVKGITEELIQTPDFGITDEQNGSKARTATENTRIAQLQDVGSSFNGEIFRRRLARLYKHVWGLLLQFKRADLSYLTNGELKTMPAEALHAAYLLLPGGRSDAWNKQQNLGRAVARFQMFKGAPNINQDELTADVIREDDAAKVKTLLIPQGLKAASEAEDEAYEIAILVEGFPAGVRPDEDHATRVNTLLQYLDAQHMQGKPVDPLAQQRIQQHLATHLQYLKQMNPDAARQVMAQIQAMEQAQMQEAAGQAQPMEPAEPAMAAM